MDLKLLQVNVLHVAFFFKILSAPKNIKNINVYKFIFNFFRLDRNTYSAL